MQTRFSGAELAKPGTAGAEQAIRTCVHCGFCTATCPTYLLTGDELDGPRGRIYLMQEMLEGRAAPSAATVSHIDRCLSCLSCRTTCPSSVDYARLVDHTRAYIEHHYRRPMGDRLMRALLPEILTRPRRLNAALGLARLAKPFAPMLPRRLRAMLDLAPVAAPREHPASDPPRPSPARGRVRLLAGCVQSVVAPQIATAARRVLERAGYAVSLQADEGCCGGLDLHLGHQEAARRRALQLVETLTLALERGGIDRVVVLTSGCGPTVKDFGHLLRDDPIWADAAQRVADAALDLTEILDDLDLPVMWGRRPRVACHTACSVQHGQKLGDRTRRVLANLGCETPPVAEAHLCCGSAGVYNILQPELAGPLRERKAANLRAVAPDFVVTGNIGCMLQIGAAVPEPVLHLAEVVDWATGGPVPAAIQNDKQRGGT